MKKIIIGLIACASLLCWADEDQSSGNYYHSICSRSPLSCDYYVSGAIDGLFYGLALSDGAASREDQERKLGFCRPATATVEQARDAFIKYLFMHAESRDKPAISLAVLAWKQAWPCK